MKNSNNKAAKISKETKAETLKALHALHARVLKQDTNEIHREPKKTSIIIKAMDRDLARIRYVMALVEVKL